MGETASAEEERASRVQKQLVTHIARNIEVIL